MKGEGPTAIHRCADVSVTTHKNRTFNTMKVKPWANIAFKMLAYRFPVSKQV